MLEDTLSVVTFLVVKVDTWVRNNELAIDQQVSIGYNIF